MIPDIIGYVIDNKTRLNLLRLSNYFWKVRRCYYKLNDIWLEQKNILQKLNKSLPYSNVWNKCNLIRHHLTLFFNNLISYFINEVIESEWTVLQRKLREGNPTFDDLKKAVQVFIENLLNKTFVETKYANIFDKLQCIFNICERFVNSYRILCCAYNEYLYNLLNEGEEKRRAAGNFSQPFPHKKKDCLKSSFKLMNNLWDTYENIYYELLQQFKQIDELRSLEYKFDFNLFHEMNHERKMAKIYYQNLK
jgi:hypothetical protein